MWGHLIVGYDIKWKESMQRPAAVASLAIFRYSGPSRVSPNGVCRKQAGSQASYWIVQRSCHSAASSYALHHSTVLQLQAARNNQF